MASNCPDCRLANLDRWTGEMTLPRELGALDGPVFSDVSFEGSAIIRAGGGDTPVAASHTRYGTARWILILCAWTIVGLLFAVRRIVPGEGTGRQLCFPYTRVRITIASAPIRAFKT